MSPLGDKAPRPRRGSAERPEPPEKRALPVKQSVGVILCRQNPQTRRPEVLLVHKRYSYSFVRFVHGHYAWGRAGGPVRGVAALLGGMTTEELLDVWSLDFGQMWYRIWLTRDEADERYRKKKAKFAAAFLADGGGALRAAVRQARPGGALLWEPPRGRPAPRESELACALRELREETGVGKADFRLVPGARRRESHVCAWTRYVCTYHVGVANPHLAAAPAHPTGRPAIRDVENMGEVSETGWHDIERLRLLDRDGRLERLVAPAFRIAKKYQQGRWTARAARPRCDARPRAPLSPGGDKARPAEGDAPREARHAE